MFGRRQLALVLLLSFLSIGSLQGAPGVSAMQAADCARLAWYVGEIHAAGEQIDAQEASGPDMDRIETWSAADFDQTLAFYDQLLIAVQGIDPPPVAAQFHQVYLEGIRLAQEMFAEMKTAGAFVMLGYLEPLAELNQRIFDSSLPLEEGCGLAIFDHDEDGEPEIGMGNAPVIASPAAPPVAEAQSTVPIGTTVQTSDAFSLTIVSVAQDALEAVQDANPGSVPPDGFQYVNVEIKLGHLRDRTDTFELENLVALGSTGVAYSAVNNSCGFVNGLLSPGEYGGTLTMTGHVCFVIASQDVAGLRLYDDSQSEEERVYFSLDPEGS